jgi:hypothetical protein
LISRLLGRQVGNMIVRLASMLLDVIVYIGLKFKGERRDMVSNSRARAPASSVKIHKRQATTQKNPGSILTGSCSLKLATRARTPKHPPTPILRVHNYNSGTNLPSKLRCSSGVKVSKYGTSYLHCAYLVSSKPDRETIQ